MSKKNKNYSRIWETKDGYAWVLFLGESPQYHHGVEMTKAHAEEEIKWIIATEQRKKDML